MKKLGDFAEVIVGQIMSRVTMVSSEDKKTVKVLIPKAISAGCIDDDAITEEEVSIKTDETRFTKEGDVVIKLATPYEGALIDSEHVGLLIPSFCAIIRVGDKKKSVDKSFLCAALNSNYVREQIKRKVAGAKMPMIKVSDLRSIEFPDVELEEMKAIGKEYLLSCRKRLLLKKLEENEKSIMDARIMNCLCEEK